MAMNNDNLEQYEREHKNISKKENAVSVFAAIVSIIIPLIVIGPIVYLFFICYSDSGDGSFLFLTILGILFYFALVFICLRVTSDSTNTSSETRNTVRSQDSGLDLGTKLMLGAMGAKLLNNAIEKEKKKSKERDRETFFWQESIREKNNIHDDFHDDDW